VSLSNSSLPNEGFVQIITDSGTKNVCGKSLLNNTKNVVCAQLGYKKEGSLVEKAVPPNNKDAIFSGSIACNGGEKNLSQCSVTVAPSESCSELSYIKCKYLLKTCWTLTKIERTEHIFRNGRNEKYKSRLLPH
jgi:hypothetical protein